MSWCVTGIFFERINREDDGPWKLNNIYLQNFVHLSLILNTSLYLVQVDIDYDWDILVHLKKSVHTHELNSCSKSTVKARPARSISQIDNL